MPAEENAFASIDACNLSLFCCCCYVFLSVNPAVAMAEGQFGFAGSIPLFAGITLILYFSRFSSAFCRIVERHGVGALAVSAGLLAFAAALPSLGQIESWALHTAANALCSFSAGLGLGLGFVVRLPLFLAYIGGLYRRGNLLGGLAAFFIVPSTVSIAVVAWIDGDCLYVAIVLCLVSHYLHGISLKSGRCSGYPSEVLKGREGTALVIGLLFGVALSLLQGQGSQLPFNALPLATILFAVLLIAIVGITHEIDAFTVVGKTSYFSTFVLLVVALFVPDDLRAIPLGLSLSVWLFRIAEYILVTAASQRPAGRAQDVRGLNGAQDVQDAPDALDAPSPQARKAHYASSFFLGITLGNFAVYVIYKSPLVDSLELISIFVSLAVLFGGIFYSHFLLDPSYNWTAPMAGRTPDEASGEVPQQEAAPAIPASVEPDLQAVVEKYRLTQRESEVFALLARGHSADGIASRLVISKNTARSHIYSIYRKLGVNSHQKFMDLIEAL